jgi:hypothetical protein
MLVVVLVQRAWSGMPWLQLTSKVERGLWTAPALGDRALMDFRMSSIAAARSARAWRAARMRARCTASRAGTDLLRLRTSLVQRRDLSLQSGAPTWAAAVRGRHAWRGCSAGAAVPPDGAAAALFGICG